MFAVKSKACEGFYKTISAIFFRNIKSFIHLDPWKNHHELQLVLYYHSQSYIFFDHKSRIFQLIIYCLYQFFYYILSHQQCLLYQRIFLGNAKTISFKFLETHLLVQILINCNVNVDASPLKVTSSWLSSSK